jgi:hypothetical protein
VGRARARFRFENGSPAKKANRKLLRHLRANLHDFFNRIVPMAVNPSALWPRWRRWFDVAVAFAGVGAQSCFRRGSYGVHHAHLYEVILEHGMD